MERTNILYLESLPEKEKDTWKVGSDSFQVDSGMVDLITIDAGWTKLELILPIVQKFLKPGGKIIALMKPQYEAEKKDLIKGVLPFEKAEEVKNRVIEKIVHSKLYIVNWMDSPILGGAGNQEYLLCLTTK